jgi:hypothetical protein
MNRPDNSSLNLMGILLNWGFYALGILRAADWHEQASDAPIVTGVRLSSIQPIRYFYFLGGIT